MVSDVEHTPDLKLEWIPDGVANVLHTNGIHEKYELAAALRHLVNPATVYRAFPNEDWSGRTSATAVLIAMVITFGVPLNRLVVEPATQYPELRRPAPDMPRRAS